MKRKSIFNLEEENKFSIHITKFFNLGEENKNPIHEKKMKIQLMKRNFIFNLKEENKFSIKKNHIQFRRGKFNS